MLKFVISSKRKKNQLISKVFSHQRVINSTLTLLVKMSLKSLKDTQSERVSVEQLSDEELREWLIKLNCKSIGPITATTRQLYRRKLAELLKANNNNKDVQITKTGKPSVKGKTKVPAPAEQVNERGINISKKEFKGDAGIIQEILGLSDMALRAAYKALFEVNLGPITDSTRPAYQNRLIKTRSKALGIEFSSDDEDMDWDD